MAFALIDVIDDSDRRAHVARALQDGSVPPTTVLAEQNSSLFAWVPVVDLVEVYLEGRRHVPLAIILRSLGLTTLSTVGDLTELQRARLSHALCFWPG